MRDLPTGTVTFLFTDVEGSTRWLHELGNTYADVLAEHRRVLRDAFRRHGGVEVDTQGDAFFVAFPQASRALDAAAEARDALSAGPVRVRMGLHTGEPIVTEEGYVGIDVHRAARIAAAGHGGQILVSQSTRDLAGAAALRDLGEHRLKDLAAPERIYQLGEEEFPPLKSLNQTNLPVQPTPFIGRERELRELHGLLSDHALVTLTGAGGSGKTRLALQTAAELVDEHPDGVWFVSLAAVTDPELVEPTITHVLGAREDLRTHLRGKRLLLLLDNLEQLLPGVAPLVAGLGAKVLATSRERLNVSGEQEYAVPSLAPQESVALFTERARQLKPSFQPDAAVAEIAARLEGLPLALELAASRVKVLTPAQIVERLGRSLDLLTTGARDAPERQRTLRATIEWSYDLLNDHQRAALTRLAVFAGGFGLEAAELVCGVSLEDLQSLVDKSLLRQTDAGRFFMLETIREFAGEQLEESPTASSVRRAHAEWIRDIALSAREELRGERQAECLEVLATEHANIRAALDFAVASGDAQLALVIAGSLGRFWIFRGLDREGRQRLEAALALPQAVPDEARWRSLYWQSIIVEDFGDAAEALALAESALALARELDAADAISGSLHVVVRMLIDRGDVERAGRLLDEGERRASREGDERGMSVLWFERGRLLLWQGDTAAAQGYFEREVETIRRLGDRQVVAWAELYLALARGILGQRAESRALLRESLSTSVELGFAVGIAGCLQVAARLALLENDVPRAAGLLIRADRLSEVVGVARRGVDGELFSDQPWSEVRERLPEAQLNRLRADVPLGDLDEAVAYVSAYLD